MDTTKLAIALMAQVKEYVQPALDAMAKAFEERERDLLARVDAIVATLPEHAKAAALDALATLPVPVNGKDADPAFIAEQVMAAVAALPKPQDGKSVSPEDLRPMLADEVAKAVAALPVPEPIEMRIDSSGIVEAVKAGIEEATKELPSEEEIKLHVDRSVAASVASAIAALPVPRDGESVTLEQVQPMIDAAVKALPPALPGKDAAPVDMTVVAELVKREVQALPKPADGKSITLDDVRPMVNEFLAKIPVPKDGASVSIEDMASRIESVVESKQASWELQFERRAQDRLQTVIDRIPVPKDGKDGKDGADAIDIDGLSFELKDGGRILVASLKRGEHVKTCELVTEFPVYREQWKEGQEYGRGDEVTFAGSTWIARSATQSRPETDDTWKLRTKRGRDGKDGRNGIDKTAPVKLP